MLGCPFGFGSLMLVGTFTILPAHLVYNPLSGRHLSILGAKSKNKVS